jgi:BirA family biotin operon repressor/biotin-[acetyl-CoA-carboxylase] ligase
MATRAEPSPPFRLLRLPEIDSTNEEAHRRAGAGEPSGLLISAQTQTAGRGRRGRSWVSKPGNLFCSLLLRPVEPLATVAQLSFVAGLAVAEAIQAHLPQSHLPVGAVAGEEGRITLKWPNDVLVDGKKIAGILLESRTAATRGSGRGGPATSGSDGIRLDWLVIGIGVNVAHHPADCDFPATSLAALGAVSDSQSLLIDVAAGLNRWTSVWQARGFPPVREAWLAQGYGLGQPISVRLGETTLQGCFETLDISGALVLREADGRRQLVAAGDVYRD